MIGPTNNYRISYRKHFLHQCTPFKITRHANSYYDFYFFYLAMQRSVWRDIKFAVFYVCTVDDISTQDGAIGVKFWLRVEQTSGTGTR